MNREDGFASADIAVDLLHDPKVIALVRRNRDECATAVHVALYVALVLASWAAGDRVPLDEALPAWWLGPIDEARAALQSVGLIDDQSRVSLNGWESWFLPAFDRRERKRAGGAEGGRKSWESRREKHGRTNASTSRSAKPNPSVPPSGRPSDRQAGRGSSQPTPIGGVVSEIQTCAICQDELLVEPWKPRKTATNDGRMENVHDRCYLEAKAS